MILIQLKNGALSVLSPDLLSDRIQVEQQKVLCHIHVHVYKKPLLDFYMYSTSLLDVVKSA